MTQFSPAYLDKIVNPELARAAMHSVEPHGEFKAYVRLAAPEQRPSYMKFMELYSPGIFKAFIPCAQIENVADDSNVLSVELCEHISSYSAT
jgi:hypothetical protein